MSTIQVNYIKSKDGGFVAQCPNSPQFIIQAEKKDQIKDKMTNLIKDYVIAFPEERNIVLPAGEINFQIKLQQENIR